jgi:murein DD-endopeptidase MepM/ murein hydrolase activator NlpD
LAVGLPAAQAGPKDDKRKVEKQLEGAKQDLDESSAALQQATAALQAAETNLAAAKSKLATVRGQLAAAKAKDKAMAVKLTAARVSVFKAKKSLGAAQGRVKQQRQAIAEFANANYQQAGLGELAAVFNSESPGDLLGRLQIVDSVAESQANSLNQLNDARAEVAAKKAALEAAEAEAERQRVEAADNLERMRDLEKQQVDATNAVSRYVTERSAIQASAKTAKAEDERQYSDLLAERERIEKELKELARKEAEEERKRKEKERKERERKKKNDDGGGNDNDDDGGGEDNDDGGGDDNGSGLSRPVNGYITSPYGMRFHPILHRWKLHDGTDFGAGCGTPIRAAASGKVIRRYYNGGYGNRIFVSHGRINGTSVVTSYNHLSRYSARVGETVSRGEVIGYVGTTGYSTGCHLHFMVYENGDTVNPMRWL